MRICFVLPYCPPDANPDPSAYLDRFVLLRHLPQQLSGLGHTVHVVLQHHIAADYHERGVRYHLVAERHWARAVAMRIAALTRREPEHLVPARATVARTLELTPEFVHVFGLVPHINLARIGGALASAAIPWVAQYHGGAPARTRIAQRLQRRALARPAALLFTTREHAEPFVKAGLLEDGDRIVEVMESSSAYRRRGDRASARRQSGLDGSPVLLSVARMHPLKDPLTVLRGFALLLQSLPDARLHMVYRSEELLAEIVHYLHARPALSQQVTLHGATAPEAMEATYNSADFLLQASRREYSGYAVLEAMSCGVIPVVTNIPSFRAMLGPEFKHLLFEAGDAEGLAARVVAAWNGNPQRLAAHIVERFERHSSFAAIARQLDALYARLL